MSTPHKRAMEAVLEAADLDIKAALEERGITDKHSEEADDTILDVAILHAWRIFVRINEAQGLTVDPGLFVDLASELAEDMAEDREQ
ncbi:MULTISPECIES: hypothetical protein [Nitrospirillum]|jgi:hypothetical protein|uniref:Uncharacterized protein n=1 Tax=Nitrospirillum amazonense TaxID=28077 RepID=A0A560FAP6_9PROT|nr:MULTISPECIES: hypothetical protein [Nitrospirillum]MEE3626471.1 hypothetical protein [Nitrospirillum sp. BR 11752]MDZ5647037.1 hypothetical protein [Nitrospirillum sp. BR 11828]MEA1649897.1 hypothetical protein [Nitrospirillum sp. BR 11164]MEC4593455.1 hypothetical protein [Nitrospirillum amazonense]TWB18682.1 hypothetical protein FBZ89_10963 [Nitrospirillum amazonense]